MSAMNVIRAAQEAFMDMPAAVRDRFGHDAAKFVDFVNDESNYDEALKMGIVNKRPVAASTGVSDTFPTPPTTPPVPAAPEAA